MSLSWALSMCMCGCACGVSVSLFTGLDWTGLDCTGVMKIVTTLTSHLMVNVPESTYIDTAHVVHGHLQSTSVQRQSHEVSRQSSFY